MKGFWTMKESIHEPLKNNEVDDVLYGSPQRAHGALSFGGNWEAAKEIVVVRMHVNTSPTNLDSPY